MKTAGINNAFLVTPCDIYDQIFPKKLGCQDDHETSVKNSNVILCTSPCERLPHHDVTFAGFF